ncbi:BBE domain-containing protein [Streptomyces sp. NBC_00249]
MEVRATYDPDNAFRHSKNIRPDRRSPGRVTCGPGSLSGSGAR